jgi:molecular chaperone GrpE (heat shock protein)
MSIIKRGKAPTSKNAELEHLAEELAKLRGEIRGLREERDSVKEATDLRRKIVQLQIDKDKLTEDNAREIREVTHKTGLLKTKQEHEVEHATRLAKLEVRESNLTAERERFEAEMAFQREHMQREVDRFDGIAKALMERLPVIDVNLEGAVTAPVKAPARGRSSSARKSEG